MGFREKGVVVDVVVLIALLAALAFVAGGVAVRRARGQPRVTHDRPQAPAPEVGVEIAKAPARPTDVVETFRVRDPQAPDRELLVEFMPPDMAQLANASGNGEAPDGSNPALRNAFDGVVNSIPKAAALLEAGMTMRVVGPPDVLAGLAKGSYEMVNSAGQTLGVVRDVTSGKFAGHLRFGQAGVTPATGALAVFQVMSVVTGQYYLHRIDSKLNTISKGVKTLVRGQTAAVFGQVEAAAKLNEQVRANLLDGIPPNRSDFHDLEHAEQLVLVAYGSLRKKVADFLGDVEAVKLPELPKSELRRLWSEAQSDLREEAALLAYAAFVRHQNNLLALAIEPQGDARRAENIQDRIEEERRAMLADLKKVQRIYDKLMFSERKLAAEFVFSGKVIEESKAFRRETSEIRKVTRDLDKRLLPPAPEPDIPFIAEIQRDRHGELQVTGAVLRRKD